LSAPGNTEAFPLPTHRGRCPEEMVDVEGRFCIDRYEASLVDRQGRALSPYYPPTSAQTRSNYDTWQRKRLTVGRASVRLMPVPEPPEWQLTDSFEAVARSVPDVVPHGYLSGATARDVCERANKRLCTTDEWQTACGGERRRRYPYGDEYVDGQCNVNRSLHPARELHGDASIGHFDPRLNQVAAEGQPLLRKTGETRTCTSAWGDDAIYDMVGNLDEWVDEPGGRFLGGFYSRDTTRGCDASVSSHAFSYYDYSLGTRCCR
jgi:formylglycine-generating enzyme